MGGDTWVGEFVGAITISIRTPAWGVTANLHHNQAIVYFNSHPRVGGDFCDIYDLSSFGISIRTPAWGVTHNILFLSVTSVFQFAPPRGG